MNIDDWFKQIRQKYSGQMQCGKGCTACCHGLFDISLADAADVAKGLQSLSPEVQQRVYAKAAALHSAIHDAMPELSQPTLFSEDDPRIDAIVEGANSPPCPCLGDQGECLIYEHRPLSCRLEGVPMIDTRDGLFGDWCELNFETGLPETASSDFVLDYDAINAGEETRSTEIARRAGFADPRAVTFIPSAIVERRFYDPTVSR